MRAGVVRRRTSGKIRSPFRDVAAFVSHVARLGYEVRDVVDVGERTVVEFAGRVSGVVVLDADPDGLYERYSLRVRESDGGLAPVDSSHVADRSGGLLSREDLVTHPYATAAEHRRLALLRASLDPAIRDRYLAPPRAGETIVEVVALQGLVVTSPEEVAAATAVLEDLVAGVPLEWVRRRAEASAAS